MEKSNATVLVVGASGYIGSHLVPALIHQGYNVRASARRQHELQALFISLQAAVNV